MANRSTSGSMESMSSVLARFDGSFSSLCYCADHIPKCWIPTDSFVTNVTPEKYRAWIELMVPANQKMIRYEAISSSKPILTLTQGMGRWHLRKRGLLQRLRRTWHHGLAGFHV